MSRWSWCHLLARVSAATHSLLLARHGSRDRGHCRPHCQSGRLGANLGATGRVTCRSARASRRLEKRRRARFRYLLPEGCALMAFASSWRSAEPGIFPGQQVGRGHDAGPHEQVCGLDMHPGHQKSAPVDIDHRMPILPRCKQEGEQRVGHRRGILAGMGLDLAEIALRVTITISQEGECAGRKSGRYQARGARMRLRVGRSNSAAVTSRSVAS